MEFVLKPVAPDVDVPSSYINESSIDDHCVDNDHDDSTIYPSRSQFDDCIYFQKLKDRSFIYLLLYVDDMLIASRDMLSIRKLKTQLSNEFKLK